MRRDRGQYPHIGNATAADAVAAIRASTAVQATVRRKAQARGNRFVEVRFVEVRFVEVRFVELRNDGISIISSMWSYRPSRGAAQSAPLSAAVHRGNGGCPPTWLNGTDFSVQSKETNRDSGITS